MVVDFFIPANIIYGNSSSVVFLCKMGNFVFSLENTITLKLVTELYYFGS